MLPIRTSGRDRYGSSRCARSTATAAIAVAALVAVPSAARADVPVQRTFTKLASSNGSGAVLLDLSQAKLTHFREHLFAAEEPQIDASGADVWKNNQPLAVATRDLLYDAYFGLRVTGAQAWLTKAAVDLDASGYAPWTTDKKGGTGVATMVQHVGAIEATTYVFAPRALGHAGFVLALRVRNTGSTTAMGVSAFSLHNFHLGFGRPGVNADIGDENETVVFDPAKGDFLERAFAGVIVARPLGTMTHHAAWSSGSTPGQNAFSIVDAGGATDLPDFSGQSATANGWATAYEFDVGDLAPGAERWVGVAFAHYGDPSGGATVQSWLDTYVGTSDAKLLVDGEVAAWTAFQQQHVHVSEAVSSDVETVVRHSAAVLAMAQVADDHAFLREFLTVDNEPRYTRFGTTLGGPPAALPATVAHRGKGAVIASLPPGEWTIAWARDGAYAATAMAHVGMKDEAKAALTYELDAEAGRFQKWNELMAYSMPAYAISLVRYYGFGVEETDVNDFGPNLEFDGLGLFLWALREYERATGDTSIADANWSVVTQKIADVLVALVDPNVGLLRPDSSIWETHWKGRQRTWTYTNIAAVRGLCDAAAIAERRMDMQHAAAYRQAATNLRAAIAKKLTDTAGALASNAEELATGNGYWDAAVLDAIALGLFDPKGRIATATLAGIDKHLAAPAGAGWSRNDDRTDHAGSTDLSPWGSDYDSAEWVFTDMRGAIAERLAGNADRANRLVTWVQNQTLANYLAVAETYDEGTGTYKFNAPMVGFGAGALTLAELDAAGALDHEPACGAYFDEGGTTGGAAGGPAGAGSETGSGACGCRAATPRTCGAAAATTLLLALVALGRRYRRSRTRGADRRVEP